MLTKLIVVIISQYIHVSNLHIVHLKVHNVIWQLNLNNLQKIVNNVFSVKELFTTLFYMERRGFFVFVFVLFFVFLFVSRVWLYFAV